MRLKDIMVLGFALVVAVSVVIFIRLTINRKEASNAKAPVQVQKVKFKNILVAKRNISVGETVTNTMFTWKEWPESALTPSYITKEQFNPKLYDGWIVQRRVLDGEPLTKEDFIYLGASSALASSITPGMRAFTMAADEVTLMGGLLRVGDLVDVIAPERSGQDGAMASTIVEKVRIVAIGSQLDKEDAKDKDPNTSHPVAKTLTLEVSPNQAESLASALRTSGSLYLTVYSIATLMEPKTDGIRDPAFERRNEVPETYFITPPPLTEGPGGTQAGPQGPSLRIIRGANPIEEKNPGQMAGASDTGFGTGSYN